MRNAMGWLRRPGGTHSKGVVEVPVVDDDYTAVREFAATASMTDGEKSVSGLGWLVAHDAIIVRQRTETVSATSGAEIKNRVSILPSNPSIFKQKRRPGGFLVLPPAMYRAPFLRAAEESNFVERSCCPLFRRIDMSFKDSYGTEAFSVERPCTFEPCQCWPLCFTQVQQVLLRDRTGQATASAREPLHTWCRSGLRSGCTRVFVGEDGSGTVVYEVRASQCHSHNGTTNLCAPSCCNESFDVDVFTPEGEYINSSTFAWPGCAGLHTSPSQSPLTHRSIQHASRVAYKAAYDIPSLCLHMPSIDDNFRWPSYVHTMYKHVSHCPCAFTGTTAEASRTDPCFCSSCHRVAPSPSVPPSSQRCSSSISQRWSAAGSLTATTPEGPQQEEARPKRWPWSGDGGSVHVDGRVRR